MIYVKVKRLHPAAKLPAYATSGPAAMDFEAVEIKPCVDSNGAISSSWWVYTGLAMEIPVTNGAIVIHTQRLKSDPGGNLLS